MHLMDLQGYTGPRTKGYKTSLTQAANKGKVSDCLSSVALEGLLKGKVHAQHAGTEKSPVAHGAAGSTLYRLLHAGIQLLSTRDSSLCQTLLIKTLVVQG